MASELWFKNSADSGKQIVAVGLVSGGKILTGRRRDNGLWTSPGGHMEEGEQNDDAAVREVLEETGIRIQGQDLQHLSSQTIVSPRTGKEFKLHCYLANIPQEQATAKNDPDQEIDEWKWVDIDPAVPELKPEARHAKDDVILNYLFEKGTGLKNVQEDPAVSELGLPADLAKEYADAGGEYFMPFDQQHQKIHEALKNGPVWKKAERASEHALGHLSYPFAMWWYERHGGK